MPFTSFVSSPIGNDSLHRSLRSRTPERKHGADAILRHVSIGKKLVFLKERSFFWSDATVAISRLNSSRRKPIASCNINALLETKEHAGRRVGGSIARTATSRTPFSIIQKRFYLSRRVTGIVASPTRIHSGKVDVLEKYVPRISTRRFRIFSGTKNQRTRKGQEKDKTSALRKYRSTVSGSCSCLAFNLFHSLDLALIPTTASSHKYPDLAIIPPSSGFALSIDLTATHPSVPFTHLSFSLSLCCAVLEKHFPLSLVLAFPTSTFLSYATGTEVGTFALRTKQIARGNEQQARVIADESAKGQEKLKRTSMRRLSWTCKRIRDLIPVDQLCHLNAKTPRYSREACRVSEFRDYAIRCTSTNESRVSTNAKKRSRILFLLFSWQTLDAEEQFPNEARLLAR